MAVLDPETRYAERLCDYTNHKRKLPLRAVAFSDFESYAAFSKTHKVKLLLAEEALIAGEYELRADQVIALCGNEAGARSGSGGNGFRGSLPVSCDARIYKYQSGEEILREVMTALGEGSAGFFQPPSGKTAKLISVFSPVGRCGKTSFALLFSVLKARTDKVLYLNFEMFSGLSELLSETPRTGLSDALYHLKQGTLDPAKLSALLYRFQGVDYLPPARSAEDMMTAEDEDYAALLEFLLRETEYDYIIADTGGFCAATADILDLSDCIYMPVKDDFISEGKRSEAERYFKEAGKEALLKRIKQIRLPDPGSIRSRGLYLESLLLSPFGDYVRSLAG